MANRYMNKSRKTQNEGFFDDRMRKLFFIYGNTSTTEREEIRSVVEKETQFNHHCIVWDF